MALRPGERVSSPALRRRLTALGLTAPRPVFRGHVDWNVWALTPSGPPAQRARAVPALEATPGVSWAELDQV
ncbi:MAG: hypothetical protein M3155_04070, partial [Actinomycetota bacterium]|nr:hypothetical protein [Actinomycetota bacterium]